MTYELGKQLKDAGFPQKENQVERYVGRPSEREYVYYPTLEELIERCGEEFVELTRITPSMWHSTSKAGWVIGKGPAPAEALANLWLLLNE